MNCTTKAKVAEGRFFVCLNGGYYILHTQGDLFLSCMLSFHAPFTCCAHELFTVLIIISVMEKMRENTFPLRVLRNIVFKRHPHRLRASSPSLDSVLFILLITSRISLCGTTFTSEDIIFSRLWTIYLFNYDYLQAFQVT